MRLPGDDIMSDIMFYLDFPVKKMSSPMDTMITTKISAALSHHITKLSLDTPSKLKFIPAPHKSQYLRNQDFVLISESISAGLDERTHALAFYAEKGTTEATDFPP